MDSVSQSLPLHDTERGLGPVSELRDQLCVPMNVFYINALMICSHSHNTMPLYELKALLVTVIVPPVYSGYRDPFLKAKANMMSVELEDICFICPTHQFSFSWTLNIDIYFWRKARCGQYARETTKKPTCFECANCVDIWVLFQDKLEQMRTYHYVIIITDSSYIWDPSLPES